MVRNLLIYLFYTSYIISLTVCGNSNPITSMFVNISNLITKDLTLRNSKENCRSYYMLLNKSVWYTARTGTLLHRETMCNCVALKLYFSHHEYYVIYFILICFYVFGTYESPHTIHKLQSSNLSLFGLFKPLRSRIVYAWILINPGTTTWKTRFLIGWSTQQFNSVALCSRCGT